MGTTALAWVAVIGLEYNNEDSDFSVIYPSIILGLYLLVMPVTTFLVNGNWEKTIKFFDKTEITVFEEEKKEAEGP